MEKILFVIICFLTTANYHACFGQNTNQVIDSLLGVLKAAKQDTNEVKTLNKLSENYRGLGEFDQSKKYADDAFRLAEKIDFKKGKIPALLSLGICHYYQGDFPNALNNFNAALKISEELGIKRLIANSHNAIAAIYKSQGNMQEALKNFNIALKIFEETRDTLGMAAAYNNIAIVYDNQGNFTKALKLYLISLRLTESAGDRVGLADTYLNIGMVYTSQKNYDDALEAHFSALKIYEEFGDKYGVSKCYSAIGQAYQGQCNLPAARDYTLKSLAIYQQFGDKVSMAANHNTIGMILKEEGDLAESLKNHLKASELFQEVGDTLHLAQTYNFLGEIYGKLNRYNEAEAHLRQGLMFANAVGSKAEMLMNYKNAAELFENRDDFKNAYIYHKLFTEVKDSIFNENKSQQLAELKVQYETEQNENQIALLNKDQALHLAEIKKQKILKSILMGGLLLAGLLGFFAYKYSRNTQALKVQTMRNKIASDLHDDVGSSLTSIRLYSEIGKKQTTDPQVTGVLDKIGQNVGEVIQSMGDIVWMINPKYDAFGSVFSRMENFASEMLSPLNIQYTIKKDNEVEALKFSMAERQNIFMIFKEAIHNAAKHANCKTVSIHLSRTKDQLRMNITDDGLGFDNEEIQRGNGLSNMENRAAEINGTITVSASAGKGTSVTLNMLV